MMNASLERCFSFINSHTVTPSGRFQEPQLRRAVTISRQAGCGAVQIAGKLADYLQRHLPQEHTQWTVFDRDLMEQVLADHNMPKYLAKFLPEDHISRIADTVEDIFGVHPPAEQIVQKTAETILKLAQLGGAIIIGRAGSIVTAKLSGVIQVRLVAPLEDRIVRICRDDHKTPDEARRFCLEEEQARIRYVKRYFNADINDPLHYHLVINTSRLGLDNAVETIGNAVLHADRSSAVLTS